jgi:hypothetical protein
MSDIANGFHSADLTTLDDTVDIDRYLHIVQTLRALLQAPPTEEFKRLVTLHLEQTKDRLMGGFLRLLMSDDKAHRQMAESAFRELERRVQERVATRQALPIKDDPEPVSVRSAPPTDTTQDARYVPYVHANPEMQGIDFRISSDPNVAPVRYTCITNELTAEDIGRPITHVAGLVIGVRGQKEIEHGFGFYLPFKSGVLAIDHGGNKRNILNIEMGLPHAIALYDDHRGPHLGGVSDFFTILEAMRDGYRFLMDLEIIPVNGRYMLSMQRNIWIERQSSNGTPSRVASVHLKKLLHATDNIDFIAFTGEVIVS